MPSFYWNQMDDEIASSLRLLPSLSFFYDSSVSQSAGSRKLPFAAPPRLGIPATTWGSHRISRRSP